MKQAKAITFFPNEDGSVYTVKVFDHYLPPEKPRPLKVGDYVKVKPGNTLCHYGGENEIVQIVKTGLAYDWHIRLANGFTLGADSSELEFVAEGTVAQ